MSDRFFWLSPSFPCVRSVHFTPFPPLKHRILRRFSVFYAFRRTPLPPPVVLFRMINTLIRVTKNFSVQRHANLFNFCLRKSFFSILYTLWTRGAFSKSITSISTIPHWNPVGVLTKIQFSFLNNFYAFRRIHSLPLSIRVINCMIRVTTEKKHQYTKLHYLFSFSYKICETFEKTFAKSILNAEKKLHKYQKIIQTKVEFFLTNKNDVLFFF